MPNRVFTGIVEGKAEVSSVDEGEEFRTLTLQFPEGSLNRAKVGASVAINGTCLTIVEVLRDTCELKFDVIAETLRRTNLGDLVLGDACNFERAARIGDEIGGHNVSGHVHTTASLCEQERTGDRNVRFRVKLGDPEYAKYVLPKGYVAIDGISLTVGEVSDDEGEFNLYLIPETLRVTTLGEKPVGGIVNVEIDSQTQTIVDTIEKLKARGDL